MYILSRHVGGTTARNSQNISTAQSSLGPIKVGKLVAFSATDAQSQEHLWLVNSDGSGLHQLTTDNGDHLLTFSPNGQYIYYVHFTGEPSIYKISVVGGAPARVSDMVAIPLDVSPDGQLLLCGLSRSEDR